jgi:hypothetical protein
MDHVCISTIVPAYGEPDVRSPWTLGNQVRDTSSFPIDRFSRHGNYNPTYHASVYPSPSPQPHTQHRLSILYSANRSFFAGLVLASIDPIDFFAYTIRLHAPPRGRLFLRLYLSKDVSTQLALSSADHKQGHREHVGFYPNASRYL